MYLESWYYVFRVMVLCIKESWYYVLEAWDYVLDVRYYVLEFWLCRRSAYELGLAIRPIKVVLILCSPVFLS